jgi:thioredoxin reductase (NADPH)
MENNKIYDMIIVGAGPAGMTAGIYAARAGLKVVMLEKGAPGGQMVSTYEVDNYTGFETIGGPELSMKMFEHTQKFGVEYAYGNVTKIEDQGKEKVVITDTGSFTGKTVVIGTGAINKQLGAPGEAELAGKGISWCAICDGAFYKGKEVVVIGGGNSAIEEATYLAGIVGKVTIIHRRQGFRADKVALERAQKNEKIHFELDAVVEKFNALDGKLGSVTVKNVVSGETKDIPCSGAFIYVGLIPVTDMFKGLIDLDPSGYILANAQMETNVKGIYAIGDVRQKELRQVVTAANDGAIAAQNALKYIESLED